MVDHLGLAGGLLILGRIRCDGFLPCYVPYVSRKVLVNALTGEVPVSPLCGLRPAILGSPAIKIAHEILHSPNVARFQQSSLKGRLANMGPQV